MYPYSKTSGFHNSYFRGCLFFVIASYSFVWCSFSFMITCPIYFLYFVCKSNLRISSVQNTYYKYLYIFARFNSQNGLFGRSNGATVLVRHYRSVFLPSWTLVGKYFLIGLNIRKKKKIEMVFAYILKICV